MKNFAFMIFFIFIVSCNNIEFIYKDDKNLINPLYEKTRVDTSGVDLNFVNSYLPMFFGKNKEDLFTLLIIIEEEKTKRSIETNQATSRLRYELKFTYTLVENRNNCVLFEKEILSYFTIIPKSSGYNYGTDVSLEKKYELATIENLNKFITMLSEVDIDGC